MPSSYSGKMRCLRGCAEREKQPLQKTTFLAKSKAQRLNQKLGSKEISLNLLYT